MRHLLVLLVLILALPAIAKPTISLEINNTDSIGLCHPEYKDMREAVQTVLKRRGVTLHHNSDWTLGINTYSTEYRTTEVAHCFLLINVRLFSYSILNGKRVKAVLHEENYFMNTSGRVRHKREAIRAVGWMAKGSLIMAKQLGVWENELF